MKGKHEVPYSRENMMALQAKMKIMTGDVVLLRGLPYHEAPLAKQIDYWGEFLGVVKACCGDARVSL